MIKGDDMASSVIIPAVIVAASLLVGFGAHYALKSDPQAEAVVEKLAEQVIKQESGIDIDFEQQSPSKPSEPSK
jgi:hypothetical protein